MECNCTPVRTIFINEITTTITGAILIPNTTISSSELINLFKYKLIIACNLKATANLPVYIQTETGNIPLLCRYAGNSIYPDQLCSRKCYTLVFGNNSVTSSIGQFVLQNSVCKTNGTLPVTVATKSKE